MVYIQICSFLLFLKFKKSLFTAGFGSKKSLCFFGLNRRKAMEANVKTVWYHIVSRSSSLVYELQFLSFVVLVGL